MELLGYTAGLVAGRDMRYVTVTVCVRARSILDMRLALPYHTGMDAHKQQIISSDKSFNTRIRNTNSTRRVYNNTLLYINIYLQ